MEEVQRIYAVRHNDLNTRLSSRSGGMFTALSDIILKKNGVVYGCVLTEELQAVHVRATNASERNKMRGSKYLQSRLGDTFLQVKSDLISGKKVLFSGTACQVQGLLNFLGKKYDNLYTVDILCHGVPSKKVFDAYLEWAEKYFGTKVIDVDFRNKQKYGWRSHVEYLYFDNDIAYHSQIYWNLLVSGYMLRPSCYECRFNSFEHPSDITIGDFQGIDTVFPVFNDERGISLVLVNTTMGSKLFDQTKNTISFLETDAASAMQPALATPVSCPPDREEFFELLDEEGFEAVARRYAEYGQNNKMILLREKVKRRFNHMFSREL